MVEIIHKGNGHNETLIAIENHHVIGSFPYTLPKGGNTPIKIDLLAVNIEHQGKGIARLLVEDFVRRVGSGRRIRGIIIHEQSLKFLGSFCPPDTTASITKSIINLSILENVPIVKVLKSGGIITENISVTYDVNSHDFSVYEARLRGITK